jgi:hypothetical protein
VGTNKGLRDFDKIFSELDTIVTPQGTSGDLLTHVGKTLNRIEDH